MWYICCVLLLLLCSKYFYVQYTCPILVVFVLNTRKLYLSSFFTKHMSYAFRLCSHHTCSILVVFVLNTRVQYLSVFVLNTRVLLYNCRLYSQYTCPILVVFVFVLSALQFGFCSGAGSVWSRHFLPEPPLQSLSRKVQYLWLGGFSSMVAF